MVRIIILNPIRLAERVHSHLSGGGSKDNLPCNTVRDHPPLPTQMDEEWAAPVDLLQREVPPAGDVVHDARGTLDGALDQGRRCRRLHGTEGAANLSQQVNHNR